MPEGKWVSKGNLQTFWQLIRSNLASLVTTEVNNILPPIIQEDVVDAYIPDILGNFAEVEDAPTATKNYAIGDYLVLNKHFYKATAAITSGDTLVEGTNIERTNVGEEVSEILNSNAFVSGTFTKAHSSISNVERAFYKLSGNICTVDLTFTTSAAISDNTAVLFQGLPNSRERGYRILAFNKLNATVPLVLGVTIDGKIINQYSQGGIPAGHYQAYFVYIAED